MSEYRSHRSPAENPRRGPVSARTGAGLCAVAVAAFASVAILINLAITRPFYEPDLPVSAAKAAQLESVGDQIDVLFLGTSRVYRSIDPLVFDAVTRAGGKPTTSFNFGVGNMSVIEQLAFLRNLRDHPLERLRVLFLEPSTFVVPVWQNVSTARIIHNHDLEATVLGLRLKSFQRPRLRLGIALRLGVAFAQHITNRGVLADLALPRIAKLEEPNTMVLEHRGYFSAEHEHTLTFRKRRMKFLNLLQEDRDWPAPAPEVAPRDLIAAERQLFEEITQLVDEAGLELVLLSPPRPAVDAEPRILFAGLRREFPEIPYLAYHQGAGVDDLYAPEHWFDRGHLNDDAARTFTQRLAADWLALEGARRP